MARSDTVIVIGGRGVPIARMPAGGVSSCKTSARRRVNAAQNADGRQMITACALGCGFQSRLRDASSLRGHG